MYIYKWGAFDSPVFLDAKKLREIVFVKEQKFINEFDEDDKTADHLVIYQDGLPVATARVVYNSDNTCRVGRICVLKSHRKSGIGSLLLASAETEAKKNKSEEIHLGAQIQAFDFYKKLGYESYGEEYMDETTPHINMKKVL